MTDTIAFVNAELARIAKEAAASTLIKRNQRNLEIIRQVAKKWCKRTKVARLRDAMRKIESKKQQRNIFE